MAEEIKPAGAGGQAEDILKKIEERERSLYSRTYADTPVVRGLSKKDVPVKESWKSGLLPPVPPSVSAGYLRSVAKNYSKLKIVAGISALFFLVAAGIGTYLIFFKGGNIASSDNIITRIDGPAAVAGGEKLMFSFVVENRNDLAIESADLIITYPEGTHANAESPEELSQTRKPLGTIDARQVINEDIEVVLFGQEGQKEINAALEFRFKNSNATLEKEAIYIINLSSSPVNLSLNVSKEAVIGQELVLAAEIKSNSTNVIRDVLFEMSYPRGFTFKESTPLPSFGETVWNLGDLPPGGGKAITIIGITEGQDEEEQVFNASVGVKSAKDQNLIGTVYNAVAERVLVKKPFLNLDVALDGKNASEVVSKPGKSVRMDIAWESNLPSKILDAQITAKLIGEALDRFSVATGDKGFYRSVDDTALWNKSTDGTLAVIDPGEQGAVRLSFSNKPLSSAQEGKIIKNPMIIIEVGAEGRRISDVNVPESINTSITRKVKIESDLKLTSRAVRSMGPFANFGPIPPKVEQETSYTVIWTITNSSNDIGGAVVRASLPTYVRWIGAVSPPSEDVVFNQIGGEIVWNVGTIKAGTGFIMPAREIAFQIALLPSISQIGKTPTILSDASLAGEDLFTNTPLRDTKAQLTTRLATDPTFDTSDASVVP